MFHGVPPQLHSEPPEPAHDPSQRLRLPLLFERKQKSALRFCEPGEAGYVRRDAFVSVRPVLLDDVPELRELVRARVQVILHVGYLVIQSREFLQRVVLQVLKLLRLQVRRDLQRLRALLQPFAQGVRLRRRELRLRLFDLGKLRRQNGKD